MLAIPAIGKAERERCIGLGVQGSGCTVYTARPAPCRAYQCLWLQGRLTEDERPDLCGVLFSVLRLPGSGPVTLAQLVDPAAGSFELARRACDELAAGDVLALEHGREWHLRGPRERVAAVAVERSLASGAGDAGPRRG